MPLCWVKDRTWKKFANKTHIRNKKKSEEDLTVSVLASSSKYASLKYSELKYSLPKPNAQNSENHIIIIFLGHSERQYIEKNRRSIWSRWIILKFSVVKVTSKAEIGHFYGVPKFWAWLNVAMLMMRKQNAKYLQSNVYL